MVKQQQKDLRRYHLVTDLYVRELCQERRRSYQNRLVVPFESFLELYNQTFHEQLANLRKLCVDYGYHCRVDRRKRKGLSLGALNASAK